jgi:hypothetical protein
MIDARFVREGSFSARTCFSAGGHTFLCFEGFANPMFTSVFDNRHALSAPSTGGALENADAPHQPIVQRQANRGFPGPMQQEPSSGFS